MRLTIFARAVVPASIRSSRLAPPSAEVAAVVRGDSTRGDLLAMQQAGVTRILVINNAG